MIQVQIKGLKSTQNFLAELPKQQNKEIMAKSAYFMKFVQKSVKLRSPVDTGFLKDQIKVIKKGDTIILNTGEAYYAKFQEFGFTPHIIPSVYLQQHRKLSPNIPGLYEKNTGNFINVSKYTPFLFPALESGLKNLPNMLKNAVDNAIKSSGGRKNA